MIELPVEIVQVLAGAIGYLVAEGLQSLSRLLKIDLGGHATAVSAVVVALLVNVANGLLAFVPDQYIPFAKGILAFLVIVFAPAGVHGLFKRK